MTTVTFRGQLLQLLADGRFYSGAWLGRSLGISRSAVWKHVRFLQARQVEIHAVRGRGYRLARPLEMLSRQAIIGHMNNASAARLARLDVLTEVDSTNRFLLARARHGGVSGDACLAEYQSAGQGRQGRAWVSPFAGNIYMSLLWHFPCGAESLGGLGLAVGVSVLRAVHSQGGEQVRLKWPNDLVCQDKKLAGVLLEMSSDGSGGYHVVIGVGLNVSMPMAAAEDIDQPWTDLVQVLGRAPSRNLLAACLLQQLQYDIPRFQADGLSPFIDDWRRFDNLLDRPVSVSVSGLAIDGIARGIDEHGALRIDSDGRIQRYLAGDVSVRVSP
jgi:BirA family biotin operon repressor/biotin-[acetyl-CoA-carboxylase] ligase